MTEPLRYDVLVAGGGIAGATAAIALARAGLDLLVLERARFPRFHVGESLLPRQQRVFHELGMEDERPSGVHRALYSILAGHVFPRPVFALRWRLRLMELLTELQARFAFVPRRPQVYLCGAVAPPPPAMEALAAPVEAGA